MGRPAEVEHPDLVPLSDVLALADRDIARADLVHTDTHKSHEPQGRIVRLDEDDGARRQRRQVALGDADAADVDIDIRR